MFCLSVIIRLTTAESDTQPSQSRVSNSCVSQWDTQPKLLTETPNTLLFFNGKIPVSRVSERRYELLFHALALQHHISLRRAYRYRRRNKIVLLRSVPHSRDFRTVRSARSAQVRCLAVTARQPPGHWLSGQPQPARAVSQARVKGDFYLHHRKHSTLIYTSRRR